MDRSKIIIKTSIKAIITNIVLVIFKATIGLIVNSIAIVLDAVNNLSDAISSIITIIGTKLANKAPDKKHPYGHGRIEYIASVIIALIILFAGITSLKESVQKIILPEQANYSIVSLIIVGVAVLVKFFLGRYVKNTGKKINSQSLIASGTDAFFDAVVSFSTLVAAIISIIWKVSLEGYLGVIIGALIIKSGVEILRETLNTIIGIRADGELSKKIKEKLNSYEQVEGAYDLILHSYGPSKIIGGVNIQVDENMTAKEIHGLSKKIQGDIYTEFGIILTIGIYASNKTDKEAVEVKNSLEQILSKYPEVLQLHGFYLDTNENKISFDIIVDFEAENPEAITKEVISAPVIFLFKYTSYSELYCLIIFFSNFKALKYA